MNPQSLDIWKHSITIEAVRRLKLARFDFRYNHAMLEPPQARALDLSSVGDTYVEIAIIIYHAPAHKLYVQPFEVDLLSYALWSTPSPPDAHLFISAPAWACDYRDLTETP